jgi:hypothetical protein
MKAIVFRIDSGFDVSAWHGPGGHQHLRNAILDFSQIGRRDETVATFE